jgi:hypothetical protein
MVGWDGDGDREVQLHADLGARWIADYVEAVSREYNLNLDPKLSYPGIGRSDHASFRAWDYPAILIIEEFGDDFNPYYHSSEDRLRYLDLNYLHDVARLAVAALAQLATTGTTVAVESGEFDNAVTALRSVYPNPSNGTLHVRYNMHGAGEPRLILSDLLGRQVAVHHSAQSQIGSRVVRWRLPANLPAGMYFVTLATEGGRETKPVLLTAQ